MAAGCSQLRNACKTWPAFCQGQCLQAGLKGRRLFGIATPCKLWPKLQAVAENARNSLQLCQRETSLINKSRRLFGIATPCKLWPKLQASAENARSSV
jgi:hypothetical protein